jgi:hypothetical protein
LQAGSIEHPLGGVQDRPVAGAAAQVARQVVGQLLSRRHAAARCRARRPAASDITKPGVQKPHCEPWQSTIACCTGCSAPAGGTQVVDGEQRLAVQHGQELDAGVDIRARRAVAAPFPTSTVQAPQSPSAQPSLVPVQRRPRAASRAALRVVSAPVTSTTRPRWKKRTGRSTQPVCEPATRGMSLGPWDIPEPYARTQYTAYDAPDARYAGERMSERAPFSKIDLHLVKVLHTVITERSVSRAALAAASSQPAVSAQLQAAARADR